MDTKMLSQAARIIGIDENQLPEYLNKLSAREKDILVYRFGLKTGTPMTLAAVGSQFSLRAERVRQIEAKSIRKLRTAYRYATMHPNKPISAKTLIGMECSALNRKLDNLWVAKNALGRGRFSSDTNARIVLNVIKELVKRLDEGE